MLNFAINLAVDDGKVFTLDKTAGIVNCYDNQTGTSIWNSTLPDGPFYVSGLVVANGKVYCGTWNDHVDALDEATGRFLWSFQGIWVTYPGHPIPPYSVIVKDNRVYSITDAVSVHDATTGAFLWQAAPGETGTPTPSYGFGNITDFKTWSVGGYLLTGNTFDGDYVYATGGDKYSNMSFFKLNTNNGAIVWRSSVTWDDGIRIGGVNYTPNVWAVSQDQVIIENTLIVHVLFSLNATSGEELWSLNLDQPVYSPVVYGNLMLYGSADGNLNALNMGNGTIAWKTKIDPQNLFSFVNNTNPAQTSRILIDSPNQRLFWSFGVKQSETSGNYTVTVFSLDLTSGKVTWSKQIDATGLAYATLDLFGSHNIYLKGDASLWIFNESTGDLVQHMQFEHYVLAPIVAGNETFVAADLQLSAYT
jgi:outer membrane protein assembly factor BamB